MSKHLPFPARILQQHIATLGKTGSGKSSAMRVIAEHLLDDKRRICIIDPKGDWWGLKSSADGKSAGYSVIAFGDFKEPRAADVPLSPQSGRHVAELIATGNRPSILGFRGWMPGQMLQFWLEFAPTLFNTNEGELYVIIDEVHNFAPKGKIQDPQWGKCLHWTNRIMSEGRGLGLTFFVASQRPQKVHNDTLDCCETLIAMRVAHPAAREALKNWIDGNGDPTKGKEVLATLAQLKRGEAWIWSPENEFGPARVQFPMFRTFDSFAPPQLQKRVSQSGWSEVNLDQVREKLAHVVAEAKANDPKELKIEIARLKKELAAGGTGSAPKVPNVPDPGVIARAVDSAVGPLKAQIRRISQSVQRAQRSLPIVRSSLEDIEKLIASAPVPTLPTASRVSTKIDSPAPRPLPRPIHVNPDPADPTLSGPEQNILDQMAELEALGIPTAEKSQLSLMAGYTNARSGGFSEPLGRLVQRGLISYPAPGSVTITEAGRALARAVERPLSTTELHDRLRAKLGGPEGRILKELIAAYPDSINKEELAQRCGYSNPRSGGFSEPIGRLRSLGIAEYPETKSAKAADWLFLEKAG